MEEKPFECTGCKRKATITYKKIKCGEINSSKMCSMCPILQANIGIPIGDNSLTSNTFDLEKKCHNCSTNLHEVSTEGKLGCPQCYQTFEDFLLSKLSESDTIPLKSDSDIFRKKTIPIHLGNSPEILKGDETRKKLESLQSALEESLASENFERAALLRDQIKNLERKSYDKERKAS
jgi:protein arginine kinase activator